MIRLRKLVFYVCVVVYLVVCPLTILSALGYVVAPGTTPEVVKTGVLSLSTLPRGATVYVENRRYTKRTPIVLQGMRPGLYRIRLLRRGFEPWSDTVAVEVARATVLPHVFLMPRHPRRATVLSDACERLIPIPETRFVLLLRGPRLEDVLVYDMETDDAWPLLELDTPIPDASVIDVRVARGSPFVLVQAHDHNGERRLGAWIKRDEVRLTDLTGLCPWHPERVEWEPKNPRHLFAFHDGVLSRVDVEEGTVAPFFATHVLGFGLHRNAVVVLTDHLTVRRLTPEGRAEADDAFLVGSSVAVPRETFQLLMPREDTLLLWGASGMLAASPPLRLLAAGGVRGIDAGLHQRLLVWRKDAIGLLDVSDDENRAKDALPHIQWVFRHGRDIRQAFWVFRGTHVLFCDRAGVSLLDLAQPQAPRVHRLTPVRPGSLVAYAEETGTLYYLDRKTSSLSAMALLAPQELSALE